MNSPKIRFKFSNYRHVFLFFSISLVLMPFFINSPSNFKQTVVTSGFLTTSIFICNFFLGHFTLNEFIFKKKNYQLKIFFLLLASYWLIPLLMSYLITFLKTGDISFFVSLLTKTLAINALINSFLLFFYYSKITFVDMERTSNVPTPFIKKEEQFNESGQKKLMEETKKHLLLKKKQILYRIRFDQIVFLEINLNKLLVQCTDRFYEANLGLTKIIESLPSEFIQINKSIIINLSYFSELVFENEKKRYKVKIYFQEERSKLEEEFYVGRKFLTDLKKQIHLF